MSICDWQRTQYFSHSHIFSGISHWAQWILLLVWVDMGEM